MSTISTPIQGKYFEEFEVGTVFRHALSRTVTETDNLLWMFGHYVGSKQAKKTADDGRPFVS